MNDHDPTSPVRFVTPPVQPHASPRRRRALPALAAGGAVLLLGGGIAVWLLWPRPTTPPRGPPDVVAPQVVLPPVVPPPVVPPPAVAPHVIAPPAAPAPASPPAQALTPGPAPAQPFNIQTADEATILGHVADGVTAFRFADNPNIVVLDFPSLRMQGEMLNRVASLIEKAGLPRRRVLDDAELDTAIRERGDTVETYYYGHDYRAADLAFFFATADRQHVVLDAQETQLRALLEQLGWLTPGAAGALISVPRTGAAITEPMRTAMLHHELSHGEFFSDPAYTGYVEGFWLHAMTEPERVAVRKFLGSMGYDIDDEALMYNEMQAYLMFTYDPHFFVPSNVDMTPARRLQLQTAFRAGMPDGWLKAALARHLQQATK